MSFSPPWRSFWLFRVEDQLMPVSAVRWKRDLEKGRGCVRASPKHVVLPLEENGVLDHWNMPILGAASAAACPSKMTYSPGCVCLCHCSKLLNCSGTCIGKWLVSAWSWGQLIEVFGERSLSYQGLYWHFCCHHRVLVWTEVGSVTFWFKLEQICWIAFWGAEVCNCKRTQGAPGCLGTYCQYFIWRFS